MILQDFVALNLQKTNNLLNTDKIIQAVRRITSNFL